MFNLYYLFEFISPSSAPLEFSHILVIEKFRDRGDWCSPSCLTVLDITKKIKRSEESQNNGTSGGICMPAGLSLHKEELQAAAGIAGKINKQNNKNNSREGIGQMANANAKAKLGPL